MILFKNSKIVIYHNLARLIFINELGSWKYSLVSAIIKDVILSVIWV